MLLDFLYPPFCLHCEERLKGSRFFCASCAIFFELIDPTCRCPYCFIEKEGKGACNDCIETKRWGVYMAAACDYMGALKTFITHLKQGSAHHLAKTAAALMMVQFVRLNWPRPDWLVPIPKRSWLHRQNHADFIANEMSKRLDVPVARVLKSDGGTPPQSRIPSKNASFHFHEKRSIKDRVVMLIDDVIFTGSTFFSAARALDEGYPKKIYAFALARALPAE